MTFLRIILLLQPIKLLYGELFRWGSHHKCCKFTTEKQPWKRGAIAKCCVLSQLLVSFCVWRCFPDVECVLLTRILPEVPLPMPWREMVTAPVHIMAAIPEGPIMGVVIKQPQVHNGSMTANFRSHLRERSPPEQEPFKHPRTQHRLTPLAETKSSLPIIMLTAIEFSWRRVRTPLDSTTYCLRQDGIPLKVAGLHTDGIVQNFSTGLSICHITRQYQDNLDGNFSV